jgi:cytochrome P450
VAEADFATDPMPGPEMHARLRAFRAQGDVVRVRFGGGQAFLITTFDALLEGFLEVEKFPPATLYQRSIAQVIGPNFQSMEGADHRLYRRLATPAFRSRPVERFAATEMAGLAHEVIDRIVGSGRVDLVATFTRVFPFLVISRLLGVPRDAEANFHRWAWEMLSPPTVERSVSHRAAAEFTRYLAPTIESRRHAPCGDVISELVASDVDGRRLSDEEVLSHVRLMFAAGATTTHDAIGSLLSTLLTEPGAWKRVVENPSLRGGAIHELLRFETPVANLPRISADRVVGFRGIEIPPESVVLFSMAAANRDPAVYADPDGYDMTRPPRDTLTFGRGERSCPGSHLARKSLEIALDAFCERAPAMRLVGDPLEASPTGSTVRGPDRLPVELA